MNIKSDKPLSSHYRSETNNPLSPLNQSLFSKFTLPKPESFRDILRVKQEELIQLTVLKDEETELLKEQQIQLEKDLEFKLSLLKEKDNYIVTLEDELNTTKKQFIEIISREESNNTTSDRIIQDLNQTIRLLKQNEKESIETTTRLSQKLSNFEKEHNDEIKKVKTILESVITSQNEKISRIEMEHMTEISKIKNNYEGVKVEREKMHQTLSDQKDSEINSYKGKALYYENQVETLRRFLEESQGNSATLRKKLEISENQLKSEQHIHEQALFECEQVMGLLRVEVEQYKLKFMENERFMKEKEEKLKARVSELEKKSIEQDKEKLKLDNKWSVTKEKFKKEKEAQLKDILTQIELLKTKQREVLRKTKDEYKEQINTLNCQLDEEKTRYQKQSNVIESLKSENLTMVSDMQDEIWTREGEINVLRQKVEDLESELTVTRRKLESNEFTLLEYDKRQLDIENKNNETFNELNSVKSDLDRSQTNLLEKTRLLEKAEIEEKLNSDYIRRLNETISSLETEILELNTRVKQNDNNNVNQMKQRINFLEMDKADLHNTLTNERKCIEELMNEKNQLEDTIKHLNKTMLSLESSLKDKHSSHSQYLNEISTLNTKIASLHEDIYNSKLQTNQERDNERYGWLRDLEKLTGDLEKVVELRDNAEEKVSQLEIKLHEAISDNKKMSSSFQKLNNEYDSVILELNALKEREIERKYDNTNSIISLTDISGSIQDIDFDKYKGNVEDLIGVIMRVGGEECGRRAWELYEYKSDDIWRKIIQLIVYEDNDPDFNDVNSIKLTNHIDLLTERLSQVTKERDSVMKTNNRLKTIINSSHKLTKYQ